MSWKNPIKPKSDIPSFNDVMEEDKIPSFGEVMGEKKSGGENGLQQSVPTTSQLISDQDYSGKRPAAYSLHPFKIGANLTGTPVPATLDEAHTLDKDKSKAVGYNVWNKFLMGIGEVSSGVADLMFQGIQKVMPKDPYSQGAEADLKKFREEGLPTIRTATKELLGAKVSPQQEQNFNDNFWTSALGGLAQTVPAMLGTKGTGFLFQAYDNGLQTIDNTPAGKDLPESTKTIFGLGVGAAQAAIFKLGLDKIFGKNVSKVATNLAIKTFTNLVKTAEVPITADLFEAVLSNAAKSLKYRVLNSAVKVGTSAATGFAMGSAIEGSNQLAEALTNKIENKDIFEPKTWGERFSSILHAGASTAVGGGILGAATLPFSETQNYISKKVSEAKTPEDIVALKYELADKIPDLSDEEAQHINGLIDDYVKVNQTIPDTVPNRKEVADKIMERDDIKNEISKKQDELLNTDEAFQPDIQKEISVLNERANGINDEIIKGEPENITKPIELSVGEKQEWDNLPLSEKLKLAKENLPEFDDRTDTELANIADTRAKELLNKLHSEQPENKTAATTPEEIKPESIAPENQPEVIPEDHPEIKKLEPGVSQNEIEGMMKPLRGKVKSQMVKVNEIDSEGNTTVKEMKAKDAHLETVKQIKLLDLITDCLTKTA